MKILFTGDFCPFNGYKAKCSARLKTLISEADYAFTNLECPLTNSNGKIEKCGPSIKATPCQIEVLKSFGFNAVTLANNHLKDFDDAGVLDTLRTCKANGILTVGAGKNLEESRDPLIIGEGGSRVAVLNFAEKEFSCARTSSAGANQFDLINVLQDIKKVLSKVKKVIVVIHGGLEAISLPSPESMRTLRFIAEQDGVIAIIRHHSHRIQGMEMWNGVPIIYSLGNFYFPWKPKVPNRGWYDGMIAMLEITDNRCDVACYKSVFDQLDTDEVCMDFNEMEDISLPDDEYIKSFWIKKFNELKMPYLSMLLLPTGLLQRILSKLHLFTFFPITRIKENLILNCIRCESHREAIINALER